MSSKAKENNKDKSIALLLALVIIIVPLIVKLYKVQISSFEFRIVKSDETAIDLFSYYKSVVLILFSSLIFILCAVKASMGKIKLSLKDPVLIMACVYSLLAILSSVFSEYGIIVLRGLVERHESIWVLLSYMTVFLASYLFIRSRDNLDLIVYAIFISMALVGTIGFFQFIGKDFFATELAKKLVMGKYYNPKASLQIVFDHVYSTLYNPNCAGLYASMLTLFCLVISALMPTRSYKKYIALWFLVLMIINLIGSNSAGALIGTASAVLILFMIAVVYFIYTKKYKHLTRTVIISVATLFAVLIAFTVSNGFIRAKVSSVFDLLTNSYEAESPHFFKDLAINGHEVDFYTNAGKLSLFYDKNDNLFRFKDDSRIYEAVGSMEDAGNENGVIYSYSVDGFGEINLQHVDKVFSTNISGVVFVFYINEDNITALNKRFEPVDINAPVRSFGFEGNELFGTGRGYIWSRSLPLVLDNLIIGSGPDTFVFAFPLDDIVGKLKFLGSPYITVDKPHNFYLQTAINTGFLSLLALMALFVIYIVQTIRIIFKQEKNSYVFTMQIAFFGAVLGYLITALSTDSLVSVAPVFWIILGSGFGVNKGSLR